MAFKLAKHQGFAAGLHKQTDKAALAENIRQDLILRKESALAHCLLCSDKTLEQNSRKDVDAAQTKHNAVILGKLKERYGIS